MDDEPSFQLAKQKLVQRHSAHSERPALGLDSEDMTWDPVSAGYEHHELLDETQVD